MPGWLEILLACAGTLNVVGLVAWIVKTLFELRSRIALAEAQLADLNESCVFCSKDKRDMFRRLERLDRVNVAIATKMGIDLSAYNVES